MARLHAPASAGRENTTRGALLLKQLRWFALALISISAFVAAVTASAQAVLPAPVIVSSGWQLQDVAKVPDTGDMVSIDGFLTTGWYAATVPGTVLTSLVNDHIYADPVYGENNRPESIPETLSRTSYWYRTVVMVPTSTGSTLRRRCGSTASRLARRRALSFAGSSTSRIR
jgi:hypothetical protein